MRVEYATSDGTATAGSDYLSKAGTMTFASGIVSQTLTIVVNGDLEEELDETFSVVLSNASNATLDRPQGQATILNDDGAAVRCGD